MFVFQSFVVYLLFRLALCAHTSPHTYSQQQQQLQ